MSEIPEWAKERAVDLASAECSECEGVYDRELVKLRPDTRAFARYIAEHEEPPVDPLEAEAVEIADEHLINLSAMPRAELALMAALRRGIEIGKSDAA